MRPSTTRKKWERFSSAAAAGPPLGGLSFSPGLGIDGRTRLSWPSEPRSMQEVVFSAENAPLLGFLSSSSTSRLRDPQRPELMVSPQGGHASPHVPDPTMGRRESLPERRVVSVSAFRREPFRACDVRLATVPTSLSRDFSREAAGRATSPSLVRPLVGLSSPRQLCMRPSSALVDLGRASRLLTLAGPFPDHRSPHLSTRVHSTTDQTPFRVSHPPPNGPAR